MTNSNRSLKVFLCHAHSDKDAVKALYDRLVKDGVDAWLDKEILLPGQGWRNEIQRAVRGADVVVVCHSREFNQEGFRQREVRWALDTAMEKPEGTIFIVPARLEDCDVLDSLSEWHWVDLFEDNGYEILMRSLRHRANSLGAVLQAKGSDAKKTPSFNKKKKAVSRKTVSTPQTKGSTTKKTLSPGEEKQRSVDESVRAPKKIYKPKISYVDDVGGDLLNIPRDQLQRQADAPFKAGDRQATLDKLKAMNVLLRIEKGQGVNHFWKLPYGEPTWMTIPAGEFWMGSEKGGDDEKPIRKLYLPEFKISRAPIANAQYAIYIKDSSSQPPSNWRGSQVPAGLENHPVTRVTWYDAMKYCNWLGEKINQPVMLPSEAEWEKAARGDNDNREYPWGNKWAELHCNSDELGLKETTPVGLFLNDASPYGVLDLSGNVWEWTRSNYKTREDDLKSGQSRVLRGGALDSSPRNVRCAYRSWAVPHFWGDLNGFGFRIVVSSRNAV